MSDWEPLGRAVANHARGHARHVINVFWLGYLLLHEPRLRDWFIAAWKCNLIKRKNAGAVIHEDALEALSNSWFYAGLFHDIAYCVEEHDGVDKKVKEVFGNFSELVTFKYGELTFSSDFQAGTNKLFDDLAPEAIRNLKPEWDHSLSIQHPDHGVLAAVHLTRSVDDPKQRCYAREAARAMIIHNLIGKIDSNSIGFLSWEDEPIACLLLLCDQIQTWDRERGDKKLIDKDEPDRAELLELSVTNGATQPNIIMSIDYIAPRYLDHAPIIFKRIQDELEEVIEKKPKTALSHIKRPWPFSVSVKCWLSGKRLSRKMEFS